MTGAGPPLPPGGPAAGTVRPVARRGTLQTLQIGRAVAALLVVLFHAGGTLAREKYFGDVALGTFRAFEYGGDAGVFFFFVLSGFIITHVHWRDLDRPAGLAAYVRKRAVRIYPTYWILFGAVCLGTLFVPSLGDTTPRDPAVLARTLLLLPQDAHTTGGTGAPVLIVAWSLQYELVFYAVFAVAIVNRWAFGVVGGAFLVLCGWSWWSGGEDFPRRFLGNPLIFLFAMGMGAAVAGRSRLRLPAPGGVAAAALAVLAGVTVVAYDTAWPLPRVAYVWTYGGASAVLIFALTRYEQHRARPLPETLPSLLGDSSYALYLLHFPLVSVLCRFCVAFLPKTVPGAWAALGLNVLACTVAAILFHLFVERPLLRRLAPARPLGGERNAADRERLA